MNKYISECDPETHEIIVNACRAYDNGEITREERDAVIMEAIRHDTEMKMLGGA